MSTLTSDIDVLLADVYQRIRDRNLETGERWNLTIETGAYLTPWQVTIACRHRAFRCDGVLEDALKDVLAQWQLETEKPA